MDDLQLYTSIRNEIIVNHVLMHVLTMAVVIMLLVGIRIIEHRQSVLSVFLPLLSLSWVAAIVRFDFLIHRQGVYLRSLEAALQKRGLDLPYWESWKLTLQSTKYLMPITDGIAMLIVVSPTLYLLFGPANSLFKEKNWPAYSAYCWTLIILMLALICSLPFIPRLAAM